MQIGEESCHSYLINLLMNIECTAPLLGLVPFEMEGWRFHFVEGDPLETYPLSWVLRNGAIDDAFLWRNFISSKTFFQKDALRDAPSDSTWSEDSTIFVSLLPNKQYTVVNQLYILSKIATAI